MFLRILFVYHVSGSIAHTSGSLITRNDMCGLWPREQPCGNNLMAMLSVNTSQQFSRTQGKCCVLGNSRSCATIIANTEITIDDVLEHVISKFAEFMHTEPDLLLLCDNNARHIIDSNKKEMLLAAVCKVFNMTKVADVKWKTVVDDAFGNPAQPFTMATKLYMSTSCWLKSGTQTHVKETNMQQNSSSPAALFYQKHMRSCATSPWGSTISARESTAARIEMSRGGSCVLSSHEGHPSTDCWKDSRATGCMRGASELHRRLAASACTTS